MKNQFILSSLFLLGCTGLIQANSTPTVSRVYGDPFTAGVVPTQPLGNIGELVPTGVFGTNGSVSIATQLTGGQAQAVQVLSDGTFLVALSEAASDSVVAKYSSLGTVQSSVQFGTNGVADLGVNRLVARAMMIDTQSRIVVAGGAALGTAGWLKRVSAHGDTVVTFDTTSSWQYIAGLAEQTTGNLIAVGFNGTDAQIARYTVGTASAAGALDTTFGTNGFIVLDASGSVLPAATTGLYSVAIDASNNIYVAFVASSTAHSFTSDSAYIARFTAAGVFDTTWGTAGVAPLAALNSATSGLYLAKDVAGNFIVGAQVSPDIVVTGVTSAGATIGGFTTFSTSILDGNDTYVITDLVTTSDNKIFILGSDTTSKQMAVIRLVGTTGALDTDFNTTGYNLFSIGSPDTTSQIQSMSVAPDGQLYTVGYQVDAGTTTPYVSVVYNDVYVSQVVQSPATVEQGNLDLSFGDSSRQTYAGVVTPFNGMYGSSLKQQAQDAIEITTTSGAALGVPAVGDVLVGMSGLNNGSSTSSMMFSWLDSSGAVDTTINPSNILGSAGSLVLTHDADISTLAPHEYLTSTFQGGSGIVYVAGYASLTAGSASLYATLRAYSTAGTTTWTDGSASFYASESGPLFKGLAVGTQSFPTGNPRILFFVQDSATTGHISGYTSGGILDTSYGVGVTGSNIYGAGGTDGSGIIASNSYGLNMGPVYGGVLTQADTLIVAYKNSGTDQIDVAAFDNDGSGLETTFATSGTYSNLFTPTTGITQDNVRVCRQTETNSHIIVAAVTNTALKIACLDPVTGALITSFGISGILTQTITGATVLKLRDVTGVSNGMVLVSCYDDTTDDTMYLIRVTLDGALDTTFNSQGSQPGVLPVQIGNQVANYTIRTLNSALVQSTAGANQGNIVIAGSESLTSADSTPMVLRSYGTSATTENNSYQVSEGATPGTFDAAANLTAVFGASAGRVVYMYPAGNTYQGMMLVGVTNGSNSLIARIRIADQSLDTTFGTAGVYTITGQAGINCITIDAENNILAGGTTSTLAGWAVQMNPNASVAAVVMTMPSGVTGVNQILQQKSGRYIIAGQGTDTAVSSISLLMAFQDKLVGSATTLAVDPTFNPRALGLVPAGSYSLGTTNPGCYSFAINTNDTILAATADGDGFVVVTNVTADGSGNVVTFNAGGPLTTTVPTANATVCQVAIDSLGKVVVAASNANATSVAVCRYTSAGETDTTWNSSGAVVTISNLGDSGVILADMMQTTSQQTVLVGYNATGGNGSLFAARLTSAGALDATWNPNPTSPDTAGVLTYASGTTPEATSLSDAAITIDGTIASVGSTAGTGGAPIITFVYGDAYVTEVAPQPLQALAGTLDSTIPGNVNGALALSGIVTGVPQKIYIYSPTVENGAMLVASKVDSTGTVYITKLNADLSLGTFGTSGVTSFAPNSNLSPTAVTITDLYVATNNSDRIYVTGYTTTSGVNTAFAEYLTANGATTIAVRPVSALSATTASPVSGGIRQSTNGRVIISGYNGSSGTIVAYNSAMTAIDTSFGNGSGTGYYTTAINNPIVAMTTDNSDRIYIAYQLDATTINVQRLLENGTALDTSFGPAGTVTITGTAVSATQIKLSIDLSNNQLIVAAQDTVATFGIYLVNRYKLLDGAIAGSQVSVSVASKSLSLSDLFIDNDATGSAYPNIYVAGTNTTDNYSVIARLATTSTIMALDSTYGTAGIANLSEDAMTVVTAAGLNPDRRVYLVGSNGSTDGYMGRFFGDYYWTQASQAIAQAGVGTIDTTLYPNYTGGINLADQTGWSSLAAYKASVIIENPNGDGTSFIAFGNDTNLIVGKVNADMVPVTAFNTTGLTTALAMATVDNITIDASGNIIVVGTDASLQKVVSFTPAGAQNATFAAAPIASIAGRGVRQQKSGRYIVGGKTASSGIITAYQNQSAISSAVLPVDPTFGANGLSGYYLTGVNKQIDDFVIDSNDYIYIVYRDGSNNVNVAKLTSEGALATSANSPSAQVWSTNPLQLSGIGVANQRPHIGINGAGNLLIGASTTALDVKVILINGANAAVIGSVLSVYTTDTPVLTKIVGSISTQNEFYGSMYTTPTPRNAVVFAVTAAGAIDTSFNVDGTPGSLATNVQSPYLVNGLSVQPDGKVVMVGSTIALSPILIRAYGYPYMSLYAQAPNLIAAGLLDTTLWPTTGALELNTYTPISNTITTDILSGSSVSRIYEYTSGANSGKALLVFSNTNTGEDTVLARVNKDLTLDTSFNTTGFITIRGFNNASSLFVDSDANIFVAGTTSGVSWICAYDNAGVALTGWPAPTSYLTAATQVGVQSSDRVIVSGINTTGKLFGYTTTGRIDDTFGINGSVDMGTTNAITDFTIDQYDNIITVSNSSGSVVLRKVSASGLGTPVTSAGTQITTATSGSNIKVVLDQAGRIIVAAATATGFALRSYNNDATLTLNATVGTITAGATSPVWVLSNIYATSDDKITLIGYDSASGSSTASQVMVARFVSASGGLTLDTTFNAAGTSPSGAGYLVTAIGTEAFLALDAIIGADNRIMIAGSQASDPYLARVFGDDYVSYDSQGQTQGVAGTIDQTFGSTTPPTGIYVYSDSATGRAILPLADGGYYMALSGGVYSTVARTLADGSLDTSFNSTGLSGNITTFVANSIMMDGSSRLVLTSTSGGNAKIARYVSGNTGTLDTTFGTSGIVTISGATQANAIVEQTLARYVVAGANSTGAALYAYTALQGNQSSPGATGILDTTFGQGIGIVSIGSTNGIYNLIADQYDRLIFAVLNTAGTGIDLYRLTPTGQLDATFGNAGKVANVFTTTASSSGFDASSIRVAFDSAGNIVVAAYVYTSGTTTANINIAAYDNGTSTTTGGNGAVWTNACAIENVVGTGNAAVSLTSLATTADNYVLVLGNALGGSAAASPTWIARLANTIQNGTYALDTAFNPTGLNGAGSTGGITGIFEYTNATLGTTSPYNVYNDMTVLPDGRIVAVGYEGSATTPTVIRVYNDPYTTEMIQSPNSKVIGTNDTTLGVSATFATDLGVTFYGLTGGAASYGQVARAIALQTYNNFVVAVDGASSTSGGASQIFLDTFDTDGILSSQASVLSTYAAQNVQDMVTFTTAANVQKAILAGYVTNLALSSVDSLLIQYNLASPGIDTAFGGYNGNPSGVAFGDGKQINSVARQTTGRIIAAGQSQDNLGLLLGYTAAGKLDSSFGKDGYLPVATTPALFTHAVDTENRVVVAYRASGVVEVARYLADGSGLDTSFGSSGIFTTAITVAESSDIRIALTASNTVVIAAVTNGNTVTINSYNNTTAGTPFVPSLSLTACTLAKLLVDVDGKAIVVGSDTNGGSTDDQVVIVRTNTTLSALDTTFNPNGTPGYLKYAVASGTVQNAMSAMIHPDGRILIVGSENSPA